jgi:hypothetical protein
LIGGNATGAGAGTISRTCDAVSFSHFLPRSIMGLAALDEQVFVLPGKALILAAEAG